MKIKEKKDVIPRIMKWPLVSLFNSMINEYKTTGKNMQMKQRNRKTTITIGLIPEIHLLLKIIVVITYFNSKKYFIYLMNSCQDY